MVRYIIVSLSSGFLFGILDGLINANAAAQKLLTVYAPLARTSINVPAGILIDIAYGFILARVFIILYHSLPGKTKIAKGISFALLIWFFRVVMYSASQWMMFNIPAVTIAYLLCSGLLEMLILGLFYGFTLKPEI